MTNIVNDIYEVFKDYFGEDRVDIQGSDDYWIYVYWPEVRVANENGRYIDIWGVYSKIRILSSGILDVYKPYFIRDTYNNFQWNGGYRHSHLPRVYSSSSFLCWSDSPCLGSGPINNTINKLRGRSNALPTAYLDMDIWRIFCWELDKYVHIESLAGGPYYRLEAISNMSTPNHPLPEYIYGLYRSSTISRDEDFLREFYKYLLTQKVIKIAYNNGSYCIGDSYLNTVLAISDIFIKWYNENQKYNIVSKEELLENNYIQEVIIKDNGLYDTSIREGINLLENYIGRSLGFTFKGQLVTIHKKDEIEEALPTINLILHNDIVGYIIYRILIYLNSEYGKSSSNNVSSKETTSSIKEVIKII